MISDEHYKEKYLKNSNRITYNANYHKKYRVRKRNRTRILKTLHIESAYQGGAALLCGINGWLYYDKYYRRPHYKSKINWTDRVFIYKKRNK